MCVWCARACVRGMYVRAARRERGGERGGGQREERGQRQNEIGKQTERRTDTDWQRGEGSGG
eukprot:1764573-Rhodomonas_salina.1